MKQSEPPPAQQRFMTAWTTRGDGIANMERNQVPLPAPGPEEVLVKISALSLNYRDLLVINGREGWKPPYPVVPLSDAVGRVVETGRNVTRFSVGSRVAPIFLPRWRTGPLTKDTYVNPTGGPINRGMLADYVTIHQDEAVEIPAGLDDPHAATLPVAAVTAWHAVARRSRVQAGETVLIHGTGSVALFALQFTLALGGVPIITSSSEEKLARVRALGARHTINYAASRDVPAQVQACTAGVGADHVIETIGGENLNQSLKAVKIGGTISFIGLIAGTAARINTYDFVSKNVTIHGIETGSREMFEEMTRVIEEHRILPVLDTTYSSDDVQNALKHLEAGAAFGKIVILPG